MSSNRHGKNPLKFAAVGESLVMAVESANAWSDLLNCQVSLLTPGSCFMSARDNDPNDRFFYVFGENIGWIVADMSVDWISDSFKEV